MKLRSAVLGLLLTAGVITIAFYGCQKDATSSSASSSSSSDAKKGLGAYDVPTLTCAGSTLYSIDLTVTAGATGAPSGFSVQWMTLDDYELYGWPACDGDVCTTAPSFCKASFSGNANLSRYNLIANASVTVNIGDLLFDNGASTSCPGALTCGTSYVFRVFAHGDSKKNQSRFGGNTECSTLECDENCTHFGFGHYKSDCTTIPNGLMLGTNFYTPEQLCCILNNSPNPGNGLLIVAHQLIAAKLNGVPDTDPAVINADTYIGSNILTNAIDGLGNCDNTNIGFTKAGDPNTQFPGMIGALKNANETCQ